jgi:hypothetical protein
MQYLVTRIDSMNVSAEITDWPQLLSETADDLTRIARTEAELMTVSLKRLVESETDKIVGWTLLLVALSYGSLLILGSVVLLIHLWLAWWLSLLITGAGVTWAAGAGIWRLHERRSRTQWKNNAQNN